MGIVDKAPSSVRDQVADHESNAVRYYLDLEVRVDMAAALWERPSNEAVQKEARLISLTADITAPTELTEEQKFRIRNHPEVGRLVERSKALTLQIKHKGYRTIEQAYGTRLYKKKKEADAALNRARTALRARLREKARKKHFRNADTEEFNRQFGDRSTGAVMERTPPGIPQVYRVEERATVVQLTCGPIVDVTANEEYARRLTCIKAWIKLQDRKESPRRGRLALRQKQERKSDVPESQAGKLIHSFALPLLASANTDRYRQRLFCPLESRDQLDFLTSTIRYVSLCLSLSPRLSPRLSLHLLPSLSFLAWFPPQFWVTHPRWP